ncbi:type II toxin-antitoxin system VapC family toxin [Demequina phytophila]|uniref:type II toxin-antitoxin system VapC family toxin n=1 Tax=Demequina phytophila TaxID=1638981 RepID=UPI000785E8D7|nr:type II toxin-antitoxin system VapC family toxin [Demequina phytophila]
MTVFDASALLAFLKGEPGAAMVAARLEDGVCGAANWSEVAQKVGQAGADWPLARELLLSYGLHIEPVSGPDGEAAARLWRAGSGLSLGDRLCLALGQRLGRDVLTTDTAWDGIPGVVLAR